MPTDPIGGKPPADTKASFTNFELFKDQLLYNRAFEAVLWSVPIVQKLGLRRGTLAIGGGENVVLSMSAGATPKFEALTPNNVSPYVVAMTDLRKGPVVVEVPKATDKAMLFGQIADHWYQTFVDLGPIGVDKGTGAKILQIIDEGLRAGGIGIGSTLGYMRDGVTAREVNMRDSILFISGDILWNGPYWKILDNF